MIFLIDHNLNGHALIFFGSIANQGWLDIIPIRFVTFAQSLARRGLVEKMQVEGRSKFQINPVFQQYIKSK